MNFSPFPSTTPRRSKTPDDYTQAPPAYAEGSSSRDESQGLFGPPRSSEDNLPDDFKFGGSVAEATVDKSATSRPQGIHHPDGAAGRHPQPSAPSPSSASAYRTWIQSHPGVVWVSVRNKASAPLSMKENIPNYTNQTAQLIGALVFMGLTVLEAQVLPYKPALPLALHSGPKPFSSSSRSLHARTKYDFTSWMPYLFGALWALVLFGFMAMFFPYNSTAELIYGGVAALIFSGYILVDTQLVMRHQSC
ncbi:hypothetical protein J3459_010719 [Metarhizium acridum]|nr:hypothetical protein J3459_010719 [Metarhizium acridum]